MKYFITILLLIVSGVTSGQQVAPVPLRLSQFKTPFIEVDHRYLQLLPDSSGTLRIEDVSRPPGINQFKNKVASRGVFLSHSIYWIRYSLINASDRIAAVSLRSSADRTDLYIRSHDAVFEHYVTGRNVAGLEKDGFKKLNAIPITLAPHEQIDLYQRNYAELPPAKFWLRIYDTEKLQASEMQDYEQHYVRRTTAYDMFICGCILLAAIFNFLIYLRIKSNLYLYFSLSLFCMSFIYLVELLGGFLVESSGSFHFITTIITWWTVAFLLFVRSYFDIQKTWPALNRVITAISVILTIIICLSALFQQLDTTTAFKFIKRATSLVYMIILGISIVHGLRQRGEKRTVFLIAISPFLLIVIGEILAFFFFRAWVNEETVSGYVLGGSMIWASIVFSSYLFKQYGVQQEQLLQDKLDKQQLLSEQQRERNALIAQQKIKLEQQVIERTAELQDSLETLKATQSQLIQSEKMASLGELTAGIAHEIQNPLNFVNNFSEVSGELLDDMMEQAGQGNLEEVKAIVSDLKQNLAKITQHGKRADNIVKGMLQHSRTSSGEREPTDINALANEYLQLAYHGVRARNKNFNAELKKDFDDNLGLVNVAAQDLGRVILNLITNAFYAVEERKASVAATATSIYVPVVSVSTKRQDGVVLISVADNGKGIAPNHLGKIFQPFFTTKPTGQGTGLGLSLAYDIVKAHGGELKVKSRENEGTEFTIVLPVRTSRTLT